jgi:hypothetical protein
MIVGVLPPDIIGTTQEAFPLFRCPNCKRTGTIDEDQFHGRVSVMCGSCDYHETKDWSKDG